MKQGMRRVMKRKKIRHLLIRNPYAASAPTSRLPRCKSIRLSPCVVLEIHPRKGTTIVHLFRSNVAGRGLRPKESWLNKRWSKQARNFARAQGKMLRRAEGQAAADARREARVLTSGDGVRVIR